MRSETERKVQAWREAYEKLAEISMAQYAWLKDKFPEEPEAWQAMQTWADQRKEVRAEIEHIQRQLQEELGAERMKTIFAETIAKTAETARVLTFESARKIEHAMIAAGTELNRTRDRRKLTKAYAGTEFDGSEAYFIDEKK